MSERSTRSWQVGLWAFSCRHGQGVIDLFRFLISVCTSCRLHCKLVTVDVARGLSGLAASRVCAVGATLLIYTRGVLRLQVILVYWCRFRELLIELRLVCTTVGALEVIAKEFELAAWGYVHGVATA